MLSIFIADPGGGINQIPAECKISGDVRFIIFSETFLRPFSEMILSKNLKFYLFISFVLICRLTPFYE